MEIKGGRAEHAHKREGKSLFLMNMDVSDKTEEAKKVAQVPRRQTHHPRPHFLRQLLNGQRGHLDVAEKGGALLRRIYRVHLDMDTTRTKGGNQILLRCPDKEETCNMRIRLHRTSKGLL